MDFIKVMKALSDETRIRILNILKDGDLCVCEIEAVLDINQSNASRHLTKLENSNILEYYKKGQYVYYKINWNTADEYPFIKDIIDKETPKLDQCIIDNKRLKKHRDCGLTCEDLKEGKACFDK